MDWPIASDYQEAIQNPRYCFADGDLKAGKAKENHLGPVPITGAFASVYQVTTPTGRWAVRCFLTQVDDNRHRYSAISSHLQSNPLKYAVRFEYLEQGIRIKGQWYPILKMEWIDGDQLNSFVAKHLNQPARLLQLTREWVEMMNKLKAASIAHGDLQHGNVLVTPAGLRLIDYDGMYVPALSGLVSHEEGHRNYQHPKRTGRDFGTYVDNFSAWVVFCSITAVALEPRLWQILDGGDECLLFRRDDFLQPDRSRAFQILQRSRPEVRALTDQFRSLLYLPVRNVPSLDGKIVPQDRTPAPTTPTSHVPDWLSDHVRPEPPLVDAKSGMTEADSNEANYPLANWIVDHLVDQQTPAVAMRKHSFIPERVAAMLLFVVVVTVAAASSAAVVPIFAGAWAIGVASTAGILFIIKRYGHATYIIERKQIADKLRAVQAEIKAIEIRINELVAKRQHAVTHLSELEVQFRKQERVRDRELAALQTKISSSRADFVLTRHKLASQETDTLRTMERELGQATGSLQSELNNLVNAERNDVAQALSSHQAWYVRNRLECALIRNASIIGVGDTLKSRLEALGIRTAADIIHHRVNRVAGFGVAKTHAMTNWRLGVEKQAMSSVPPLPQSDTALNAIRNRYATKRSFLESQIASAQHREQRMRDAVLEEFQKRRASCDDQERQTLAAFDQEHRSLRDKYHRELQRIDSEYRQEKIKIASVLKEHDGRLSEANFQKTQQLFEACRLQRQIDQYRRLSWGRYLARAIGLGRAS